LLSLVRDRFIETDRLAVLFLSRLFFFISKQKALVSVSQGQTNILMTEKMSAQSSAQTLHRLQRATVNNQPTVPAKRLLNGLMAPLAGFFLAPTTTHSKVCAKNQLILIEKAN
jgi:hypothetical protein